MTTKDDRVTCSICAWRGACAKKYSKSGHVTMHCVDFTKDLTIAKKFKKDSEAKELKEKHNQSEEKHGNHH